MTKHQEPTSSSASGESHVEGRDSKTGVVSSLLKGIPTLLVLVVMGGGWMVMHHINSGVSNTEDSVEVAEADTYSDTLVLPEGKLNAAKFKSVAAQSQNVQHVHIQDVYATTKQSTSTSRPQWMASWLN